MKKIDFSVDQFISSTKAPISGIAYSQRLSEMLEQLCEGDWAVVDGAFDTQIEVYLQYLLSEATFAKGISEIKTTGLYSMDLTPEKIKMRISENLKGWQPASGPNAWEEFVRAILWSFRALPRDESFFQSDLLLKAFQSNRGRELSSSEREAIQLEADKLERAEENKVTR